MSDKTRREDMNTNGCAAVAADRFAKVSRPRRRLITGGMVATPILGSLVVRNALGAVCGATPSGNVSGNVSQAGPLVTCAGASRECWDTGARKNSWGSVDKNTRFDAIFAANAAIGNDRFDQVIHYSETSGPKWLASYIVAAYLNVQNGLVSLPNMTTTTMIDLLKALWGQGVLGNYSVGSSSATWGASQIVDYLRSTGIVNDLVC